MAVFPLEGLVIGLTALVLTPEPIGPADDAMLREVLGVKLGRMRVVPFGLIRVNLGQEAIALAVNSSPDDLFTEPTDHGRCTLRAVSPVCAAHGRVKDRSSQFAVFTFQLFGGVNSQSNETSNGFHQGATPVA